MPNSRRINFLRALFPTLENTFGSRPKSHASRPRVCANLLSLLPPRLYRLVSANFSTIFLHNYDPGPSCAATLRVYIDPNIPIPVSGCTLRTGSNRILEYTKMEGTSSFPSPPLRSSTVSPLAFLTTFSISLPIFSFLLSVLRIPPYVSPIVARASFEF